MHLKIGPVSKQATVGSCQTTNTTQSFTWPGHELRKNPRHQKRHRRILPHHFEPVFPPLVCRWVSRSRSAATEPELEPNTGNISDYPDLSCSCGRCMTALQWCSASRQVSSHTLTSIDSFLRLHWEFRQAEWTGSFSLFYMMGRGSEPLQSWIIAVT